MGIYREKTDPKDGVSLYCHAKYLQYATFLPKNTAFVHHLKGLEIDMKIPNYFLIVGMITFLCFAYLPNALAAEQIPDLNSPGEIISGPNVIDVNLAVFVAEDYLPAFYEGNWVVFDSLVAYDLEGAPAAYLIIFRDTNSAIKTTEDLLAFLEKTSE